MTAHRSGFVNIVGKPNVGKSTLMNALLGEKLSIITSKAQTTRHRILGIVNGDDFQLVLSDTPGIIKPAYKMHETMMNFVHLSLEDADAFLYMVDLNDKLENQPEELQKVQQSKVPALLVLNKIDLVEPDVLKERVDHWEQAGIPIFTVSALKQTNVEALMQWMLKQLPESPPYFDKDAITDKPERFFVTEIVREKIFQNYKQEIPYSCEVVVSSFKESEDIIRIATEIYVNRKTQKPIVIGKGGSKLKKVGTDARIDMEKFFGKKVYLELYVRIKENWRDNDGMLKSFGYK